MTEKRSTLFACLTVVVIATVGVLVLLGQPLSALRASVVAGIGGDPYQTLWRFDGLERAVRQRSLTVAGEPFRNFGPLPWLPLHALVGEPLAYNLVWVLQAPLAAVAVFALARSLGMSRRAGVIGGLLAAFAPYRVAQSLGHFGSMQVFWIPATLAALRAAMRVPSVGRLSGLTALVIGTAWTEHMLFLSTLLALLPAAVIFRSEFQSPRWDRRTKATAAAGVGLVIVLGILPFANELRRVAAPDSSLTPFTEQRLRFAPTLSSLVTLPSFSVLRNLKDPYGTVRSSVADHVHALGIVAPLLAFFVLIRPGKRQPSSPQRTLLLALAIEGLALATAPHIGALSELFGRVPLFSAVRATNRFLALPAFAIPLLATDIMDRMRPKVLGHLCAALLLLEITPRPPFPAEPAALPAFYGSLAHERSGPVLEIPAAADYLIASKALYASTLHGHEPLGHNAFERVEEPRFRRELLRVPVVRDLLLLRVADLERPTFFSQYPADIALAALASENVTAVILHTKADGEPVLLVRGSDVAPAGDEEIARVREFLQRAGFREERGDDTTFLYRVPPWSLSRSAIVVAQGTGWERSVRRKDDVVQSAMQSGAEIEIRVLGASARAVSLSFRVAEGSLGATVSIQDAPTSVSRIARPGTRLRLPLGTLAPGRHRFTLRIDGNELIVENPSVLDDMRALSPT